MKFGRADSKFNGMNISSFYTYLLTLAKKCYCKKVNTNFKQKADIHKSYDFIQIHTVCTTTVFMLYTLAGKAVKFAAEFNKMQNKSY